MTNCIEADNKLEDFYIISNQQGPEDCSFIRLKIVEEKVDKLEKFVFNPVKPSIPERICDKCNGTGSFIDDGVL